MVSLFCCHSRGRYSGKFTYAASISWEVGEVIEKISRFFSDLVKLFLGPYIFIKQSKNSGINRPVFKLGAPHYQHFIQSTSILQEVIEEIFASRYFLNLLKLFVGPYIFIKHPDFS